VVKEAPKRGSKEVGGQKNETKIRCTKKRKKAMRLPPGVGSGTCTKPQELGAKGPKRKGEKKGFYVGGVRNRKGRKKVTLKVWKDRQGNASENARWGGLLKIRGGGKNGAEEKGNPAVFKNVLPLTEKRDRRGDKSYVSKGGHDRRCPACDMEPGKRSGLDYEKKYENHKSATNYNDSKKKGQINSESRKLRKDGVWGRARTNGRGRRERCI